MVPKVLDRDGSVPIQSSYFWSDEAKEHTRFVAVSEWGYVFRWINDCPMSDFEMVAWWYLRECLDSGLRWRVWVSYPSTEGLVQNNELYFNLGFSVEEQDEYFKRTKDTYDFIDQIKRMKRHFLYSFYYAKTCQTRKDMFRWFEEYLDQTEWIKERLPVPRRLGSQGRRSRQPLKLRLPSTCLLLGQSGSTSRYVCLGYRSSDSMCRTFMSASPTERASILRQKGTSTLRLV